MHSFAQLREHLSPNSRCQSIHQRKTLKKQNLPCGAHQFRIYTECIKPIKRKKVTGGRRPPTCLNPKSVQRIWGAEGPQRVLIRSQFSESGQELSCVLGRLVEERREGNLNGTCVLTLTTVYAVGIHMCRPCVLQLRRGRKPFFNPAWLTALELAVSARAHGTCFPAAAAFYAFCELLEPELVAFLTGHEVVRLPLGPKL